MISSPSETINIWLQFVLVIDRRCSWDIVKSKILISKSLKRCYFPFNLI